jgi:hypothetical protein
MCGTNRSAGQAATKCPLRMKEHALWAAQPLQPAIRTQAGKGKPRLDSSGLDSVLTLPMGLRHPVQESGSRARSG